MPSCSLRLGLGLGPAAPRGRAPSPVWGQGPRPSRRLLWPGVERSCGEREVGWGWPTATAVASRVPPAGRWALCTAQPLSAAVPPCPTPGPGLGAGDEHSRHTVAPRSCTMVLGSCGRGRDAGVRQCSWGDLGDPGAGGCDPADLQPHSHFSAFLLPAGRARQQITALRVALAGT